MRRWITVSVLTLCATGCGLVLDLDPLEVDGGRADGGEMDGGEMDAGRRDAQPPECANDNACGPRDACGDHNICRDGSCVPNTSVRVCDDGIPCTDDVCLPEGGCDFLPRPGSCNGTPDTGCSGYRCDGVFGCALTQINPCNDSIACTEDTCRLASGECDYDAVRERCPNSECEAIEPGTGCAPIECETDTPCPDDDPCVAEWACESGVCEVVAEEPDGTSCPNGNLCIVTSTCEEGVCLPAERLGCDDENRCTSDSCDSATGACSHDPDASQEGADCLLGPCTTGQCAGRTCVNGVDRCAPRTNICQTALCTAAGSCERSMPCDDQIRVCTSNPTGDCGACKPRRADCNLDGYCEHDLDDGPCAGDAGVPDAEVMPDDGGVPPVDAASCPGPTVIVGEMCPLGFADCNGDGCCDCDDLTSVCDVLAPTDCVDRECMDSTVCESEEQCCCSLCIPAAGACLACPSPGA